MKKKKIKFLGHKLVTCSWYIWVLYKRKWNWDGDFIIQIPIRHDLLVILVATFQANASLCLCYITMPVHVSFRYHVGCTTYCVIFLWNLLYFLWYDTRYCTNLAQFVLARQFFLVKILDLMWRHSLLNSADWKGIVAKNQATLITNKMGEGQHYLTHKIFLPIRCEPKLKIRIFNIEWKIARFCFKTLK